VVVLMSMGLVLFMQADVKVLEKAYTIYTNLDLYKPHRPLTVDCPRLPSLVRSLLTPSLCPPLCAVPRCPRPSTPWAS
jgi:hypothetical protein